MPSTRPFTQKPKGQSTNETIDQIDFEKVAAENRKWDLPTSQLPFDIGIYEQISIKVSQVQTNPVEAFSGTGAAESGLLALSKADHTASGMNRMISAELTVPASLKQPSDVTLDVFACCPLADGEKIVLYLHGSVYKFGSAASHRALVGQIANHASVRCVTIDYRLAPLHPYPAQLYESIAAHNPNAKHGRYVYECYADMIHVFHQFLDLPDAQYAIAKAGEFIKAL
ncbi:hypothetical protein LPJ58_004184 [Coemansia sp. RSA 1591]|nr:hypothetical protein LPJ58_004184 [Coemansia sp. RSA 1591]KAJ1758252.1 hypothetical protein LPJ69_004139 [Coemansia sp. RSA 1752]KAJ1785114.1 hypothetical protein LPJ67_004072 [Coemansia sp. RSA 1938]KAJ2445030.1 hypothetical protein IWW46_001709 [Coemansia sp. RSA 2440]